MKKGLNFSGYNADKYLQDTAGKRRMAGDIFNDKDEDESLLNKEEESTPTRASQVDYDQLAGMNEGEDIKGGTQPAWGGSNAWTKPEITPPAELEDGKVYAGGSKNFNEKTGQYETKPATPAPAPKPTPTPTPQPTPTPKTGFSSLYDPGRAHRNKFTDQSHNAWNQFMIVGPDKYHNQTTYDMGLEPYKITGSWVDNELSRRFGTDWRNT